MEATSSQTQCSVFIRFQPAKAYSDYSQVKKKKKEMFLARICKKESAGGELRFPDPKQY